MSPWFAKAIIPIATIVTTAGVVGCAPGGEQLVRKDYDPYFEWSDDRIYCSELVWKVFDRGAGIQVGLQQTMADFDLSHPTVEAKVQERYGDRIPLDEVVVSPVAIFDAANLETVYAN